MLVTVDTNDIDLVHNTEVLEASLVNLDNGWIVDVEFSNMYHYSFIGTSEDYFICSNEQIVWLDTADLVAFIQGNNPYDEEALEVTFREPSASHYSIIEHQNKVLSRVLDARDGEVFLNRFVKYHDFFIDTQDDFTPASKMKVANTVFLKEYEDTYSLASIFEYKESKE